MVTSLNDWDMVIPDIWSNILDVFMKVFLVGINLNGRLARADCTI